MQVTLNFTLAQHIRDLVLFTKIKECLGLGNINLNSSTVRWTITKNSELEILIAMFKGGFLGAKNSDFEDFCKIQEMINSGLHKTEEGLSSIILIKSGMNRKRK